MIVMDMPPQAFEQPAMVEPVGKKRRKRSRTGRNTAIAVGTILILGDGTECRVTHFDKSGQPWCVPVNN